MQVEIVLWILGIAVTILTSIIGGVILAVWALFKMLVEFRVEVSREYHTADDVEKAVQKAVEPVLHRLAAMESILMGRASHVNSEHSRDS